MKHEFCIMPESSEYSTVRLPGTARHEIFFGALRKKSIRYGLVVFLHHSMHNTSNLGVHYDRAFDMRLKTQGQRAAMAYYGWTVEDFRREFYKNYLYSNSTND